MLARIKNSVSNAPLCLECVVLSMAWVKNRANAPTLVGERYKQIWHNWEEYKKIPDLSVTMHCSADCVN